ncbi:hypothetical protein CPB86DRAFT_795110 [Serendipita vermifera]|nr:hypothetical protein CPB86DRAFT_795110 [Serendipita vermifera]
MNHVASKCLHRPLQNNARIGSRKLQAASVFSTQSLSRRTQARTKTQKATNNPSANETATSSSHTNATQSGRKVAEDLGRTTRTSSAEKSHTLNETSTNTNAEASSASSANPKSTANDAPLQYQNTSSTWTDTSFLSPYLRKYPGLYNSAKFLYDGLGLYSKQGDSVRLGKKVYLDCCDQDIIEEKWVYEVCRVPRTFNSWFQITNLHVWLLTVRLRALPSPYGKYMLQALVNFFFQDIEDRLRALLGPRTSERTIVSYMKEYRELWNGSQLSLDIGLVGGDWELAGAIWRNIFDAKGWDLGGKPDEAEDTIGPHSASHPLKDSPVTQTMGGGLSNASVGDGSTLTEIPYHVYHFVAYLRRELKRLEAIPDEEIIQTGSIGIWGRMDGLGSGDEVPETKLTPKEVETWEKMSEEAGTYR